MSFPPAVPLLEAVTIQIEYECHIVQARQMALTLAKQLGMKKVLAYYAATATSELASNLLYHATAGRRLTLKRVYQPHRFGLEIWAQDEGPGIPNLALALQDGFSTRGGLGSGLPGVRRLMDDFSIDSAVGKGTLIMARKWQPCK